MKTINDIINSLTPEERELHRELIEECMERENSLIEINQTLQTNINKLVRISENILTNINNFSKISEELRAERARREKIIEDDESSLSEAYMLATAGNKYYH